MTLRSGWVPTRAGAVWAAHHDPGAGPSGTVVVLAPPFGWAGVAAARQLRGWAERLAASGHDVVRFHFPGSGDSDGLGTEQTFEAWSQALVDVVGHARGLSGASRVAVVGLGLGGLCALSAVAQGCAVDDLVLWAVPSKGRLLLREIRAFAALTAGDLGPGDAAPAEADADGVLWSHGYPLPPAFQDGLTALDAAALDLTPVRRALVLSRGSLPHDAKLVAALEAAGAEVATAQGLGYDELTLEPRLAQPALDTEAVVTAFLRPGTPGAAGAWPQAATLQREVRLGPVAGVVVDPPDAVASVVFVGAGATPRSGPNRLWTETALRWADKGLSSVRIDLESIGEADGEPTWSTGPEGFYLERYRPQVDDVVRALPDLGLPGPVAVVGLCSGAYWAAQAGLDHASVRSVVSLNPTSLVWPPPLTALGARGRVAHLTSWSTWRPLLRDRTARRDALGRVRRSLRLVGDRLVGAPGEGSSRGPGNTLQALEALTGRGVDVTVALSPGEPALVDLGSLPAGSRARLALLEGPEGAHTLAPAGLRAQAAQVVDEALARLTAG